MTIATTTINHKNISMQSLNVNLQTDCIIILRLYGKIYGQMLKIYGHDKKNIRSYNDNIRSNAENIRSRLKNIPFFPNCNESYR